MNTTNSKTMLKTFILLLLTGFSILLFSFKNPKKSQLIKNDNMTLLPPVESDLESHGSFKMEYNKFDELGGSWDRRLILKFSITSSATGNTYGLLAYLATSQEDHAVNADPITLTSLSTEGLSLRQGKKYHLGNNYIRLRSIRKYIKAIEADNPDIKISYLKFSAVTWKRLNPEYKNRNLEDVFFLVQAFDASNNLIKAQMNGVYSINSNSATDTEEGGELSNPSPPADPSTN